jgi:flagellar hook protein FlgE
MLRSLFSGISGLRSHQQMMDVTGNNIANVNTAGFKASETVFADTLSQMLLAAAGPNVNGGTNPAQIGLGVKLAATNANFSQGATQSTGRKTDMLVQGDGFFVIADRGAQNYTRAGAFSLDTNGTLIMPDGGYVQGWMANAAGVVDPTQPPTNLAIPAGTVTDFSLSPDGSLVGVLPSGVQQVLAQIALANFNNPAGLAKVGDSMFQATINSGVAQVGTASTNGRGTFQGGALEMSNVDLAQEFTNLIIAERGFQANSKVISTSDELLQDLMNLKR